VVGGAPADLLAGVADAIVVPAVTRHSTAAIMKAPSFFFDTAVPLSLAPRMFPPGGRTLHLQVSPPNEDLP